MLGGSFTAGEADLVLKLYGDPNSHPRTRKAALDSLYSAAEIELKKLEDKMASFNPSSSNAQSSSQQDSTAPLSQDFRDKGITEDDIQATMRANGMTRAQVLNKLRGG